MDLGTALTWPEAAGAIGLLLALTVLIGGSMAALLDLRKTKIVAGHEDALRQLVGRYEQMLRTVE